MLDAGTGKRVYERQLEPLMPREPVADVYSSVSLAGGQLFVINNSGDCWALAPGRIHQEPIKSSLNQGTPATPTFSASRVFVRSGNRLLCLRKSEEWGVGRKRDAETRGRGDAETRCMRALGLSAFGLNTENVRPVRHCHFAPLRIFVSCPPPATRVQFSVFSQTPSPLAPG